MHAWRRLCSNMLHSCISQSMGPFSLLEHSRQLTALPSLTTINLGRANQHDSFAPYIGSLHASLGQRTRSHQTSAQQPSITQCTEIAQILPHSINGARSLDIHPDDVHVWWLRPPQLLLPGSADTTALLKDCVELLSQQEVEECSKSKDAITQNQRLLARAFLRSVLVQYIPIDSGTGSLEHPSELAFHRNRHGKPALVHLQQSATLGPLRFNLTHTNGLVGVAVAIGREVGIDAEPASRTIRGDVLQLARRHFSPAEVRQLEALQDSEARAAHFLRLWTLKESYVKAVGRGIGAPPGLKGFSFTLQENSDTETTTQSIIFDSLSGNKNEASRWNFALLQPTRGHVGAVCTELLGCSTGKSTLNLKTFVLGTDVEDCTTGSSDAILAIGNS